MDSLFQSLDIYVNQIAFIVAAMFGGFAHYLKKYLKKEIDIEFYQWFGKKNLAATLYTIIIFSFAIIGALGFDIINKETGFWAVLYTGFVTGFAIDSGFNSDTTLSSQLAAARADVAQLKNPTQLMPQAYNTGCDHEHEHFWASTVPSDTCDHITKPTDVDSSLAPEINDVVTSENGYATKRTDGS